MGLPKVRSARSISSGQDPADWVSSGAAEVKVLVRSGVELLGNGIEVGLRETGEVGALRASADLPALRWPNAHHRVHYLQRRHAQNLGVY